jgi:hypothetical protein
MMQDYFNQGQLGAPQQIQNVLDVARYGRVGPALNQPAPAPAPSSGGGRGSTQTVPVNPYAGTRWGSAAGLREAKNQLFQNFITGAEGAAGNYRTSVEDLVRNLNLGQRNIESQAAQNELAKMQGVQGIRGMVGRGIRSAGTMLASKNASDSSAAQAIANAYGQIGQRELGKVNTQYGVAGQNLAQQQEQQTYNLNTGIDRLLRSKDQTVNEMVNKTRDAIMALNQEIAGAGLSDKIALEQEIGRLKNDLVGRLQAYDAQLTEARKIGPGSQEERLRKAQELAQLGQVATNPFQFTTEAPQTTQETGTIANLPIFTYRKNQGQ